MEKQISDLDEININSQLVLKNKLSSNQKIIDSVCYVCNSENPQFTGSLFDGRVVDYCGECFAVVQGFKELKK